MKSHIKLCLIIFVLIILNSNISFGDCLYISGGIKGPKIEKQTLKFAEFNKEQLEYKAITKTGDYIHIQYSACDYYEMFAEYNKYNEAYDEEELIKKIIEFSKAVLSTKECATIKLYFQKNKQIPMNEKIYLYKDPGSILYIKVYKEQYFRTTIVIYSTMG